MRRRTQPEGIRITKVGFWFVLFTVVVALAATNTGNNALYMVLAVMLALLGVSGVVSRANLQRLDVDIDPPAEVFANRPFRVRLRVEHRGRWFPRWLVVCSLSHGKSHFFIPWLAAGSTATGAIDLMLPKRGLARIEFAHLWSVFPVGFFRKGLRYRLEREILVYPELYPEAAAVEERAARIGDEGTDRRGWGHELHSLRDFRPGDDPRSIHWKRSASAGGLVFMERQAEEGRRLSIVLDNAVGRLRGPDESRFERLVSEAASAVHEYLRVGYEVELVTRDKALGFGTGGVHRSRLLEHLALVEARPRSASTLRGTDPRAPEIRLAMRDEEAA